MAACADCLPIEFDLLDYRPALWKPKDSLAIAGEFRWYLTGRFPVIVVPELVKRALGNGPLYSAFLQTEADDESIMPPGSYTPGPYIPGRAGSSGSARDEGAGSNNWVLAGSRTQSGEPILASDPHVPYAAVSMWHEAHLSSAGFNVAGIAYVGVPAIMMFGAQPDAKDSTKTIATLSQGGLSLPDRDYYLKTDPKSIRAPYWAHAERAVH